MSKTLKRIIIALITLLTILGIGVKVSANSTTTRTDKVKNFNKNSFGTGVWLPTKDIDGSTGLMPQYWTEDTQRTVTLDDSRLLLSSNGWTATINGDTVYCARHGSYVRYGRFDDIKHYIYNGFTNSFQGKEFTVTLNEAITNLGYDGTIGVGLEKLKENLKDEVDYGLNEWETTYYTGHAVRDSNGNWVPETKKSTATIINTDNHQLSAIDNRAYAYIRKDGWNGGGDWNETMTSGQLESQTKRTMTELLNQIDSSINPGNWSKDVDGDYVYHGEDAITYTNGPKVVVLENNTDPSSRQRTGQETPGYKKEGTKSNYANNKRAFVLTAMENAYDTTGAGYSSKYSLNDIQNAYWYILKSEGIGKAPSGSNLALGYELWQKSIKYEQFISNVDTTEDKIITEEEYEKKIKIDDTLTKVIANRASQEYIVGPFKINYPDYEDISYIKSLSVTSSDNEISLKYSDVEGKSDFDLILENNDSTNSNGMSKKYPKNGQNFFIKIKAEKLNNKTNIKFGAQFEFLSSINIDYEKLVSTAHIYQYQAHCLVPDTQWVSQYSTHLMEKYQVNYVAKYTEGLRAELIHNEANHRNGQEELEDFSCCPNGPIVSCENKESKWTLDLHSDDGSITYNIYVPFIKMSSFKVEQNGKYEFTAQDFTIAESGKREYKTKSITSTKVIDLTIELGGKVWIDEDTGKESIANGIKDSQEKLVSNVIVTLYRQDGVVMGTAVTNTNGEYKFSGLNAMYKYFVKFTYNGQYYEPTYYTSPLDGANGWNKGNWQNNSNATDKINERETLNKKFETIGSYPNNYGQGTYGITYTKEQLLKAKVIDEFGNLVINENSAEASNPEIKSMITYVKDCRIDAYTGNNTNTGAYSYDTYPTPDIFLIDDGGTIRFAKLYIIGNPLQNHNISGIKEADISMLYPSAYYINLGLHPREDADLALKKDVDNVTLEINGQTHKYTYDTLENKTNENGEQTWDISVRLSDTYYCTAYSRELYKEDYLYKVSNYGNEDAQKYYGKTKNDELNVYITYKIMVRNQALSLRTRVDEIVDYYDQDLEYVANRSYIQISKGTNNVGKYLAMAEVNSKYSAVTNINGYNKLYVKGLGQNAQKINDAGANDGGVIQEGLYLDAGQTAYVYLTFKVVKDNRDGEQWVRLDENYENGVAIGVGKENIAEINGYSTKYAEGTKVPNIGDVSGKPAGKIDKDSNPGNLNPTDVPKDGTVNYENFEDDTDKAPNIRIVLNRDDNKTRIISGSVFEDNRTNEIGVTTVGNGFKENNETLINGVTVQLVELMENGKEFVWREFGSKQNGTASIGTGAGTGNVTEETPIINRYNLIPNYKFDENSHRGEYAFKSFAPGKYVVRFIYGDTEKTVVPNAQGGNAKSYNGQDYKSTTYQKGVVQNKTYTWDRNTQYVNGQLVLSNRPEDHYTISTFKADASNNATANFNTKEANAYLYDITASDARQDLSDAKDIASRREQVINYSGKNVTNYIAEVLASHKTDYNTLNDKNTLLKDLMQNTKMTAETGLMVIEFEKDQTTTEGNNKQNIYHITNVNLGLEERPKAQLVIEKEVSNVKLTLADGSILFDTSKSANNVLWRDHKGYDLGYKGNLLDEAKFGSIENIRKNNASSFGLIQLSMDEELMHGATIKIDYNVTVKNVGEVDYKDNKFYYTGEKSNIAKVVTTTANKVIDYVANNLQFYAKDNSNWRVINQDDIKTNGLVNDKLKNSLEQYNTIIVTEGLAKDLVPELYKEKVDKNAQASVSVPLVLTQLITAENEGDDLTYRNIVEIVQTSNTVGRRMEYSVVGNQDPLKDPEELDSSKAEVIKILPPFGGIAMYVLISVITLAVVAIVVTGVIFIKKKVLKN